MISYPVSLTNNPLDVDKYILYSPLEGAESAVFYRGMSEILQGENSIQIEFPEYVSYIASNFSILITPILSRNSQPPSQFMIPHYYCSMVEDNNFVVKGPSGKFYWHLFATRNIINKEITKSEVSGETGPYHWMERTIGATAEKVI